MTAGLLLLFLLLKPPLAGTFVSLHSYNEQQPSILSTYVQEDLDAAGRPRAPHSLNLPEVSAVVEVLAGMTGMFLYDGLKYLMGQGGQWGSSDADKRELFRAVQLNDLPKVEALLAGTDSPAVLVGARNRHGETALMAACRYGFVEMAEALLEAGADIHAQNGLGNSSILCAASKGHDNILALLLEAGADPNRTGKDGRTAVHWAAHHGHLSCLEKLLRAPTLDLSIPDCSGSTALMYAAATGNLHIIHALLRHDRAQINAVDLVGETALHRAAYHSKLGSLRVLLFTGADPSIANREGMYPHETLFGFGRKGLISFSPVSRLLMLFFNLRLAMASLSANLCADVVREITRHVLAISYTIY